MAKKKQNLSPEELLEQALVPECEWPYRVPENWVWVRIENVAELLNGFAFKSNFYSSTGIRIIRISNVQNGYIEDDKPVYYPSDLKKTVENYMLKESDLLISLTGNVGRVALLSQEMLPAALNQRVACLRQRDSQIILNKYLYFCLLRKDFIISCVKSSKGSAQLNMSTEWLKKYEIPLPPLFEQQRIVDRIESIFEKLDHAKGLIQDALDSFENRKAAILHMAFSGELTKNWREENGVGMDSWKEKNFKELGHFRLGKMLDRAKNKGELTGYLRNINVRWFAFNLSDVSLMAIKENEKEIYSICKGDLLICEGGEPGRCAIWEEESCNLVFQKALHRFRSNGSVATEFLAYYILVLHINGELSQYFTGTTIKHLTGQSLSKITMRLPSMAEQVKIVQIIDSVFLNEENAIYQSDVIDQIDLMKKSILARAFRGELGTNDPSEESDLNLLTEVLKNG